MRSMAIVLWWFNQRCQTRIENQDLRLNSLNLMAAWIMRSLWIGLAKLKRSLLVMIFQNPRKLNWQQLIWEARQDLGGSIWRSKDWGKEKPRFILGRRWNRSLESNSWLTTTATPFTAKCKSKMSISSKTIRLFQKLSIGHCWLRIVKSRGHN